MKIIRGDGRDFNDDEVRDILRSSTRPPPTRGTGRR
jgi:hypothetical protein